ncbi:deoxyhypusine synthase family protein [Candidatus Woesearchaeota archaeon]|nr:deoxyhypusine synthase family protein [Candidatus Woesearchaeota archaeon]
MKAIKHVNVEKGMKINDLIKEFSNSNVMQAGKLAKAVDILEKMIKDKDCKVFFGQAGALVPGGMKNLILDLIRNKWVDIFVTTGATLTHDLIEALGYEHYQGDENADDEELNKKGLYRMYNSYMDNRAYQKIEDFIKENFDELSKAKKINDFLKILGSKVKHKDSILRACYENNIPIFCPALSDSGLGLMVWGQLTQGKEVSVGAFDDLKDILDIAWTSKKSGVFYLGGGVPKNYIQQAMQFSKEAAYGVQVTMDKAEFGGSSGASLKEGISWGKMQSHADFVDVKVDSTIALPLIIASLKERLL